MTEDKHFGWFIHVEASLTLLISLYITYIKAYYATDFITILKGSAQLEIWKMLTNFHSLLNGCQPRSL